jgi:hypothetical protein
VTAAVAKNYTKNTVCRKYEDLFVLNLAVNIAATRQTGHTRAEGTRTVIFVQAEAESRTMSCFATFVDSYPCLYLLNPLTPNNVAQ